MKTIVELGNCLQSHPELCPQSTWDTTQDTTVHSILLAGGVGSNVSECIVDTFLDGSYRLWREGRWAGVRARPLCRWGRGVGWGGMASGSPGGVGAL